MSSSDNGLYDALVALHAGCQRQGPGDETFSSAILARLPGLLDSGGIADLGCGTGAASLWLARHLGRPVTSVDLSEEFLAGLRRQAEGQGLGHLISPLRADMGALDPAQHQFALIWSEGAAYNLTFEGALKAWRPLLTQGGIAVISEMSWFGPDRPDEAAVFWDAAYPQMAGEEANLRLAGKHGFKPLFHERLPVQAWWDGYYDPLLEKVAEHAGSASEVMQQVLAETRQEIDLFRKYSDHYGYTFYALQAV